MKKSILKNLVVLSFAFGALFLIGNNVFANFTTQASWNCKGQKGFSSVAEDGTCICFPLAEPDGGNCPNEETKKII
jgi:hypothetical protein